MLPAQGKPFLAEARVVMIKCVFDAAGAGVLANDSLIAYRSDRHFNSPRRGLKPTQSIRRWCNFRLDHPGDIKNIACLCFILGPMLICLDRKRWGDLLIHCGFDKHMMYPQCRNHRARSAYYETESF